MRMRILSVVIAAFALRMAGAQTPTVDHLTQNEMLEKAQALNAKAQAADGSASAKLNEYPNHYTMIALRHKNGGAEIHQDFSDLFFVVKGKATLLTSRGGEKAQTVGIAVLR